MINYVDQLFRYLPFFFKFEGEECQITRGTWFYEGTWQPLDRDQSSVLESKHLSMFQGHKLSEYTENEAKGTVMHTETFPEFTVEWFSPNQIYLYSENKPSKIVRSVTTRLGFSKCKCKTKKKKKKN